MIARAGSLPMRNATCEGQAEDEAMNFQDSAIDDPGTGAVPLSLILWVLGEARKNLLGREGAIPPGCFFTPAGRRKTTLLLGGASLTYQVFLAG